MDIDIYRELLNLAFKKGILINTNDHPDEVMAKLIMFLFENKEAKDG